MKTMRIYQKHDLNLGLYYYRLDWFRVQAHVYENRHVKVCEFTIKKTQDEGG